jgi:hypothetical protein
MRKEQVKKNPRGASMTPKQDDNTPKSLELSEGQLEVHFRRLNLAHTRRIYKEVQSASADPRQSASAMH